MAHAYDQLTELFRRLARFDHAITFLQWDQLVMMPSGGAEARAQAIAELTSLHHQQLTAPDVADLFAAAAEVPADVITRRSLHEMRRQWQQAVCLPADLVKAQSLAGSVCEHGWRNQRQANDWDGFLKNFREVVNLSRQEAQARQDHSTSDLATPYDALLDLYCSGDSSEMISSIFGELKRDLPALIQEVIAYQEDTVVAELSGVYPVGQQKKLGEELMRCLGFDFNQGRLDESMHPFSTGVRGDHRITTRFYSHEFAEALLATAHETGHASYEAGLPSEWDNLPLGQARNMCIHESQSLLFEKQLFLSRGFLEFFTPKIHDILPASTHLSEEQLAVALTRVQPSYIRVEADEVTYPMHVILRYDIESGLINGTLEPDDIPELWDAKMNHYLGLTTADNYSDGCLQDIHWTDGSFGYFPSYTLGAVNAAQLFTTIQAQHPDWQERLQQGDVTFICQWLAEKIWSKGCICDSQELLVEATGEGTNPAFFINHIRRRYLDEI